ncbi:MAG: lipid-binding protein [Hahellaceae bacterium]|nr:lipid-binding protein [Hahellaceae bacterium]
MTFWRFVCSAVLLNLMLSGGVTAQDASNVRHLADPGPLNPEDPAWESVSNSEGIEVRLRSIEGSDFDAFQGRKVVSARLTSILAVMEDPATCTEWVHQCSEAHKIDGNLQLSHVYGVNDMPWPTDDRDYILENRTYFSKDSPTVHRFVTVRPDYLPENGRVRVRDMKIHYFFTPLAEDRTEVIWTQHTEPGGFIPGWLVNLLLVDIPHQSLLHLESVANRLPYRSAQFLHNDQEEVTGVALP